MYQYECFLIVFKCMFNYSQWKLPGKVNHKNDCHEPLLTFIHTRNTHFLSSVVGYLAVMETGDCLVGLLQQGLLKKVGSELHLY